MTDARTAFETLDSHWAVAAIEPETRRLAIATAAARFGNAELVGAPMENEEAERLWTLATAYDLAALEGADAFVRQTRGAQYDLLRMQLEAGATRAFTLYSVLNLPSSDPVDALYRILHVAAVGIVADRRDDVRSWLELHRIPAIITAKGDAAWDEVLRSRVGSCWLELLRGTSPGGIDRIIQVLGTLREERSARERIFLAAFDEDAAARMKFHLFTLYHLLDGAATLTMYVARDGVSDIRQRLFQHFSLARAAASGDRALSVALSWLHAAACHLALRSGEQLEIPGVAAGRH